MCCLSLPEHFYLYEVEPETIQLKHLKVMTLQDVTSFCLAVLSTTHFTIYNIYKHAAFLYQHNDAI